MKGDNLTFPVADGTVKVSGDQRLRTSTLTRDRPERGEESEILEGNSDESHSSTPLQKDSTRDDEEAKSDLWTITGEFIYRHHVGPRVKLYMSSTFLIPISTSKLSEQHYTSLDVLLEKNIEDFWNVDGERELSNAWRSSTRFVLLKERPPEGYTWCEARLTRKQHTSRSDVWTRLSDAAKKKAKKSSTK